MHADIIPLRDDVLDGESRHSTLFAHRGDQIDQPLTPIHYIGTVLNVIGRKQLTDEGNIPLAEHFAVDALYYGFVFSGGIALRGDNAERCAAKGS